MNTAVSLNKNKIAQAFNRAATTYNHACDMQLFAGEKLIALLDNTIKHEHVLDVGCGTGLISQQLMNAINYQQYDAIDIAEDALCIAKNNLPNHHVRFILHDFDEPIDHGHLYSLIFSNMALHWSANIQQLLERLKKQLIPGGILAFSIPLQGSLQELNQDSVKHFHTYDAIFSDLHALHFTQSHAEKIRYVQTFSSVFDALSSLKKTGVTYCNKEKKKGLRSKQSLNSLYQHQHHRIQLTYEIGLFMGKIG